VTIEELFLDSDGEESGRAFRQNTALCCTKRECETVDQAQGAGCSCTVQRQL
jgi:hypothetical protein